ncbi:hypothetical protein [Bdellovibrio sp. HCB337]|uniref:hypothetical protein n=1 Tax=Bdellovibrio sp. HCB337 TaxID=3394358 RepID=UPI0039A4FBEC
MKNTKYFLGALLLVGTLAGCSSSWDQDPLAKKNALFKDAQQEPTVDEKPDATSSENIRLDVPQNITFREGVEGEFTMKSRILKGGFATRILIENLNDFQGARYDATSGKFVWTPPAGTVTGANGNTTEAKILKVLVLGEKPNEPVERRSWDLRLEIGKLLRDPEISAISQTSITVREGEYANITFQVVDRDAGADASTWPKVQAFPLLGYGNISQFVTFTSMSAVGMGGGTYAVSIKVDLTNAELTKSKGSFGFALQAVSRFQKESMKQNVYVNVLTSFANLQSTWFDVLDFYIGAKDEHQFLIYDPKEELLVATPTFTGAPAGATFSCSGVGVSKQLCKMIWAPDFMMAPGDFTVRANVVARNQDGSDTQTKPQTFDLRMRVNSAPPVSISRAGGK